jgi:hypothetical protein
VTKDQAEKVAGRLLENFRAQVFLRGQGNYTSDRLYKEAEAELRNAVTASIMHSPDAQQAVAAQKYEARIAELEVEIKKLEGKLADERQFGNRLLVEQAAANERAS